MLTFFELKKFYIPHKINKIQKIFFKKSMEELYVRWHSRAGQGGVTAANFFAEAMAKMGYKTQSFPDYGAEKRGAPVVVFNRFSQKDKKLDDPAHLLEIDLCLLLDPTLIGAELSYEDILQGLKNTGKLLINTAKTDSSQFNKKYTGDIFHLNATGIALDTVKRNVPNVAMVGGITKILDIDFEEMEKILVEHLSDFFPEKIVKANIMGFQRGYEEVIKL
jgi:pyruvate ferredoxin oxidoreductase gamma subunit